MIQKKYSLYFILLLAASIVAGQVNYDGTNTGSTKNLIKKKASFELSISESIPLIPKPVLKAPANNQTNVILPVTLDWNPVVGATRYTVKFYTLRNGVYVLSNQNQNIMGDSLPSLRLENDSTYYWRVIAYGQFATDRDSSEMWKFRTQSLAPQKPVLSQPANNSTIQSNETVLRWKKQTAVDSFVVQIAKTNLFEPTSLVKILTKITDTFVQVTDLPYATSLFWRVKAKKAADTSLWSDSWRFTTGPAQLQPPALVSPADKQTEVSIRPRLLWRSSATATQYEVQVATNPTFTQVIFNNNNTAIRDTFITIGKNILQNAVTYSWRIRARNAQQVTSNWSEIRSFTTEQSSNIKPVLLNPKNNDSGVSTPVVFQWQKVPNVQSYTIVIDTTVSFTSLQKIIKGSLRDTFDTVKTLNNATKYYWKIQALLPADTVESMVYSFTTKSALLLEKPKLLKPKKDTINLLPSAVFSWQKVPNATAYTIEIATDAAFTKMALTKSGISDLFYPVDKLALATKHYWRVNATNGTSTSAWSDVWSFTTIASLPPAPPELTTPSNNTLNVQSTLTLMWKSVTNVSLYLIQLSTTPAFEPPSSVLLLDSTKDVTYSLKNLALSTRFYWRVCSKNSAGIGLWSEPWSFTTVMQIPEKPTLLEPADMAIDQSISRIELKWNSLQNTATYNVMVSRDTNFTTPILSQTKVTGTTCELSGLEYSTTYYWRVQASNSAGTSQWSSRRSFTTSIAVGTPLLSLPPNNFKNQEIPATLVWRSVPKADFYTVTVSLSADFATLLTNEKTKDTLCKVNTLTTNKKYYWRVNASNIKGNGLWSETWNFTTAQDPILPAPNLTYPRNKSVIDSLTPIIKWAAVPKAVTYYLQIATTDSFKMNDIALAAASIPEDSFKILKTILNPFCKYYWRVSATDEKGQTSPWSEVWQFSTIKITPILDKGTKFSNGSFKAYPSIIENNSHAKKIAFSYTADTRLSGNLFIYNSLGNVVYSKSCTLHRGLNKEFAWWDGVNTSVQTSTQQSQGYLVILQVTDNAGSRGYCKTMIGVKE